MLSDIQKRFVAEYLKDLNASAAYLRAGYASKNPHIQASQLMDNPEVKEAIARSTEKKAIKLDLNAERVLSELMKLSFWNMQDYALQDENGNFAGVDITKLTREQAAAIMEITVDTTGGEGDGERKRVMRTRFKLADKGINLERLGRYLKLFTDKVEHSADESLARILAFNSRMNDGDHRS
jgi:phage terminase small subunit